VSRKKINYYANVYKSTSLIGVSVWWLKMVFWLWQTESVSVYLESPESVLQNLVVFSLQNFFFFFFLLALK
jgi:hypothetical protein